MAARISVRRTRVSQISTGQSFAENKHVELEDNDVLRARIERERGTGSLRRENSRRIEESDFQAILRKEGVMHNQATLEGGGSFVEKPAFDLAIALAILANSIVLGLEIDLADSTPDSLWLILENVFCLMWIGEMLLKLYFLRYSYCQDPWNYLDVFLVVLAIYDSWISPFISGIGDVAYLRVIRMLRLLRLVKLFKVMTMSRNLWLLVQGFIESFSTLCWVSFLILFVIYAYSCLFRIVVDCGTDYLNWSDCPMLFGSMPKAMYTLFQIMTLESWSMLIARPLIDINPPLLVIILSFLLLTTFGLMNIIVGVVVENTLSVAKQNMDLQNKRAERQLFKELELLRTVFEEADVDGSGTLDKIEFCDICCTNSVRRALQRMGVPLDQAETLFDIIDSSKTGEVDFPQFIEGIKNVRGVPTNLDMKTMIVAVRNIHKHQRQLEKDSIRLHKTLLKFIQEAQADGNVINLPPKEELDSLLKVRKKLVSMPTGNFSDYGGPLREEAREVFDEVRTSAMSGVSDTSAFNMQQVEVPFSISRNGTEEAEAAEAPLSAPHSDHISAPTSVEEVDEVEDSLEQSLPGQIVIPKRPASRPSSSAAWRALSDDRPREIMVTDVDNPETDLATQRRSCGLRPSTGQKSTLELPKSA